MLFDKLNYFRATDGHDLTRSLIMKRTEISVDRFEFCGIFPALAIFRTKDIDFVLAS